VLSSRHSSIARLHLVHLKNAQHYSVMLTFRPSQMTCLQDPPLLFVIIIIFTVLLICLFTFIYLLSHRSRQRERLSALLLSICSYVRLSVCRQNAKKMRFSQKLSNLELWCLLMTYRKLCKLNWAFQRTHYWIPTIQDGWDQPSWKSTWSHFFLPAVVRFW